MAYTASDLSVLAYANNFTLWHYATIDTTLDIEGAGYFNSASDMLRVNDLIIVNIDTDGVPATKFYVVTGNAGGAVTIAVYV
ncbi:MAG: hypothetical protein OEY94_06490 [Alphaproteobacteria bacterium]|nr:hypothetical protein [Alphaproteobacteria bacterium]